MSVHNPDNPREFKELVALDVFYQQNNQGDWELSARFAPTDVKRLRGNDPPLPSEPVILSVDVGHYQRALNRNNVERLRRRWDVTAHDEPSLSIRPGGSIWVVNGQHVIVAGYLEGETTILAWVYWGLSIPREASLRLKKNAGRPDTALEEFHAQLTEEWEAPGTATAIVALLEEFGTEVNRVNSRWSGVNCVGTLKRLYEVDGGVTLRRGLRLIADAFGEIKGDMARAALIEASARFMTVHRGELRYKHLIDRLRRHGPEGLFDQARGHKRVMGGPDSINVYRAMVQAYNEKLRKEEYRLEAKTSRYTVEVPSVRGFEPARTTA